MPLLETCAGLNEIVPVYGSERRSPLTGWTTVRIAVHRPGRGFWWKNCIVGAKITCVGLMRSVVLWTSTGCPLGSTSHPCTP